MKALLHATVAMFILTIGSMVQAETIVFKDGIRMTGKIVGVTEGAIRFETSNGVMVVKRDQIERIDYDPTPKAQASPEAAAPEPVPPATPQTAVPEPTYASPVPQKSIAASVIQSAPSSNSLPPQERARTQQVMIAAGYRLAANETEGGPQGSMSLLVPVSDAMSLGGSLGFAHFDNKVKTLSKGDVTVVPVMAQMAMRSPGGVAFTAGMGYAFVSHSLDSEVEALFASYGYSGEERLNGSITAEASLGFTMRTSPRSSFGIAVGYQYLKPKGEATLTELATGVTGTAKFDVELSAPFVRAHLGF